MNVQLLIIDPQNDFCSPNGNLFVPGANNDMNRLTKMIKRIGKKLNGINVTLDSHRTVDIAHPIFWIDSNGKNPDPFTIISVDDVKNGVWRATLPGLQNKAMEYVQKLKDNDRYILCIWPEHCIIGSNGHAIYPELSDELLAWEKQNFKLINYVTKGSNIFTEHYSAVKADVEQPDDPSTLLNTPLLDLLSDSDIVAITGEALSHCVANTVSDIADNFGEENIKKLVLLEDTTSNVPGFENLGEDFVKEMTSRGMKISTSVDFLK